MVLSTVVLDPDWPILNKEIPTFFFSDNYSIIILEFEKRCHYFCKKLNKFIGNVLQYSENKE
ncbi:hypothetical protein ATZ35_13620 [Enterococcus rotai]|uniref:Uncharacterized protein n=1 Tax=Enterococcus rotai TaxID=118060 RepID=A0A0U2MYV6_9ENTE|nr:hypothetical protein ATZ35_13620 [Enterococcus rotai]